MRREVAAQLHAKEGQEDAKVPGVDTIAHVFSPNHPTRLTASNHHVKFDVVRKVQTRTLKKEHEDAYYVAKIAKLAKYDAIRFRDLAAEHGYTRALEMIGADNKTGIPLGKPGLPVDSGARAHGPVFAPRDQQVSASDHDAHRQGSIQPEVTLRKTIPEHPGDSWYSGDVFVVLNDAVRPARVELPISPRPCMSLPAQPSRVASRWQVEHKSEPFRHAAQMLQLMRDGQAAAEATVRDAQAAAKAKALAAAAAEGKGSDDTSVLEAAAAAAEAAATVEADALVAKLATFWLSLQTDGGADHNPKHLKVRLALLAFFRVSKLKRLDAQRGAPNRRRSCTSASCRSSTSRCSTRPTRARRCRLRTRRSSAAAAPSPPCATRWAGARRQRRPRARC